LRRAGGEIVECWINGAAISWRCRSTARRVGCGMIFYPPPHPLPRIEGYEDLAPGQRFALGAVTIERADIFEFAAVYDPQPFHLDDGAAEASIFRGLAASGFQTTAAAFSVSVRSGLLAEVNLGGSGLDALRWLRPVRPDVMLSLVWTIEEITPTKPGRATVRIRYEVSNAAGDPVLTALVNHLIRGRPVA
jgi:acyl dehydratase